jgi:hypothetical protein
MSSLKSLAAAKSRRSSEQTHITSGTRPGTSIASQSAFAGQYQSRGVPQVQQKSMKTQEMTPQIHPNGLPFTKLTVSDAIGLITLRLGKVEQFLLDVQHEGGFSQNSESSIPSNLKLIDNSVLTSIIHRLDSLEKKESGPNMEFIGKIEKDLKETREMLMSLLFKFELFTKETTNKFSDYELAISEIEKNISFKEEPMIEEPPTELIDNDVSTITYEVENNLSAELKSMIKQEFMESMEA